jgi:hypothetical protein
MTSKFILCTLVVVLSATLSHAQASGPQTVADPVAQQELMRNAQMLVSETISQARRLKGRDNQIMARVALAELLWKDQEATARRLYQEAFDLVRQALARSSEDDGESYNGGDAVIRLRNQVLESLGRHDPAMARRLLGQVRSAQREVDPNAGEDNGSPSLEAANDNDRRLELALTIDDMDKNPKDAAKIVQKELERGSSLEVVSLLSKLAETDPKSARDLAANVVDKFRKSNFESDPAALEMAGFLLNEAVGSLRAAKQEPETKDGQAEKSIRMLSPQLSRELIVFITDAALAEPTGRSQVYLLLSLTSFIENIDEVAPEQAARLQKRISELDKVDAENNPYARLQEIGRTKDVDAMLEAARTAPVEMRQNIYSQAATAAWEQGDKARATEILTKNVSDAFERNRLLQTFHEQTLSELIQKGDFVQAHQLIGQTRSMEKRAGQLMDLAAARTTANDKKGALEILGEAQSLLPVKASNQNQLDLQIRLAHALADLDVDRSFALMGPTIEQINELTEAAARVAAFMPSPLSLQDNEFPVDSYRGVPGFGSFLSRDIRALAQADFQRTKKMLDKLQRPEIRVAAYLYLAKIILEPEPDCTCTCPDPAKKPSIEANK